MFLNGLQMVMIKSLDLILIKWYSSPVKDIKRIYYTSAELFFSAAQLCETLSN